MSDSEKPYKFVVNSWPRGESAFNFGFMAGLGFFVASGFILIVGSFLRWIFT